MNTPSPIAVVTGGSGFVGSHLVDLLLEKGYEVRCAVRRSSNLQWLQNKPVKLYYVNLTEKDQLSEILTNAQYIFHVAGTVKSLTPEGYYKGNVHTTQILLDAALQYAPNINRIVVVSSLSASGIAPQPDHIITENQICKPLTQYGHSKLAQEQLCQQYFDKIPITIIRPPAIYGERDVDILLFFKSCYKGLIATTRHEQQFSLVYVGDVVNGMLQAALSPKAQSQTYFISSERGYFWHEVADIVSQHSGKKAITLRFPNWGVRGISAIAEYVGRVRKQAAILNIDKANEMVQKSWVCSSEKAKLDFGYRPLTTLEKGIPQTLRWYEQMKWL